MQLDLIINSFSIALFIFILCYLYYLYYSTPSKYNEYTPLIKKLYPNSKFLSEGKSQCVYINNNKIIKVYNQTNFNYLKLLRKLDIYPPIYKIKKNSKYYIVEEKYLKPIRNKFVIDKYINFIFKKFKISFTDNKLSNYGIDPDTNKIYRFDCEKQDIFFFVNKNDQDLLFKIIFPSHLYIFIYSFVLVYLYLYSKNNI